MQNQTLAGGFTDPATQSAKAFRSVMDAMARPGTWQAITGAEPPAPLSRAAGCVLLTLCDADTPVYLAGEADTPDIRAWLAFHTGAPLTGPSHCMFAIGTWAALLPLSAYPIGTPDYPDRSATLIVDKADLSAPTATLTGPGIKSTASLPLPALAPFQDNHALFPLGLDFILTCDDQLAALPRSTEIQPCT
ncbi:phosphonate C-P lyase system protein PhnH [Pacificoceanicola onchidii]|uniref:phosphonate C-P lyase system protein PhnH n=1 Tax=Pacificoceanicola onchidii TaxID=2562685 RepID=UPI0010A699FE|nr:phosphonate C-P lyase system protein PhnH [Pacificoceanicola onchidii]